MTTLNQTSSQRLAQPGRFHDAAEWVHALGDIPLSRIVMDPWPGTATEQDLLTFVERDKRLVEFVDNTLVEKPVGWIESLIAMKLGSMLSEFARVRKLGVVAGADETLRMKSRSIRLPDISFIGIADLPGGKVPTESVPMLAPTLAVEVISEGNTKAEMRRKNREYFESGTKLVWFVYPKTRTIAVFEEPSDQPVRVLKEGDALDGGRVLPGFSVAVADVFKVEV